MIETCFPLYFFPEFFDPIKYALLEIANFALPFLNSPPSCMLSLSAWYEGKIYDDNNQTTERRLFFEFAHIAQRQTQEQPISIPVASTVLDVCLLLMFTFVFKRHKYQDF